MRGRHCGYRLGVVLTAVSSALRQRSRPCMPMGMGGFRSWALCAVLLIAGWAGHVVGSGGALLGVASYAPIMVLTHPGAMSHLILLFLAMTGGSIGEKLRNRQPYYSYPWHSLLSPEIYIAVLLMIIAAW